jgi:hypothetical protein
VSDRKTLDRPALFLTTQTTLPVLTSLAFAFSLGAVALAAGRDWPLTDLPVVPWSNKQVAVTCFGIAALMFLIATNACVSSHAWDYGALSPERITELHLSEEAAYKQRCQKKRNLWHKVAALSYNGGALLLLAGLAALFQGVHDFLSVIYGAVLTILIAALLLSRLV